MRDARRTRPHWAPAKGAQYGRQAVHRRGGWCCADAARCLRGEPLPVFPARCEARRKKGFGGQFHVPSSTHLAIYPHRLLMNWSSSAQLSQRTCCPVHSAQLQRIMRMAETGWIGPLVGAVTGAAYHCRSHWSELRVRKVWTRPGRIHTRTRQQPAQRRPLPLRPPPGPFFSHLHPR